VPFARTSISEVNAVFSPDGRWVAYVSDETGRPEVYVRPFQAPGEKRRVSTSGGSQPRWPREGEELFYRSPDKRLMAVPVDLRKSLELGQPRPLFHASTSPESTLDYDVSSDGRRFLVLEAVPDANAGPVVVVNWPAALRGE